MRPSLSHAWRLAASVAVALVLTPALARALTADSLASPVRFSFLPEHPCPTDTVRLVMTATECPPCVSLDSLGPLPSAGPIPALVTWNQTCIPGECFALRSLSLPLGTYPPGDYVISVHLAVREVRDSAVVDTVQSSLQLVFLVGDTCASPPPPPPPPGTLQYVTHVAIGDRAICDSAIVCSNLQCPGVPVPVEISGVFPSPCFHLISAELLPIVSAIDGPALRLVMRADSCQGGGCATLATPWSATVTLPPELPGPHELSVIQAFETCTDTTRFFPVNVAGFPYTVLASCDTDTTHVACVQRELVPPPVPPSGCGAMVPAGSATHVPLAVRTGVAVAGLQGAIGVTEPFRLTALAPLDSGFQVSWSADGRGAKYVLFSTSGAVLPPGVSPALLATVAADSSAPNGESGMMFGVVAVASDSSGNSVPLCAEPPILLAGFRLCVGEPPSGCDVNADGVADVRDLVLMARCLRHASADSDSVAFCHDCDGDGRFGIADLFCCAHDILHFRAPGDSNATHGDVQVWFGAPVATPNGVDVPVHVSGAGSLGAALVRLRYPADRWSVSLGPDPRSAVAQGWLPLAEQIEPGLVAIAGLRLADSAPSELVLKLSLDLLPGATAGGSLSVDGMQLADLAGASVQPAPAPSALVLGTAQPAGVTLSEARPNPFTRQTRFTVSLPRGAFVDLAVLDLAGRRVTTLQHGPLDAGEHAFEWAPAGVRDGVYFAKLTADGRSVTARLVLLRDSR